MGQINQPANLLDRVLRLERELAEVRKRTGLGNAVSRGSFRFLDDAGNERIYFGPLFYGPSQAGVGFQFRRHNGPVVLSLEGSDPADQFIAIRDEQNNIIFSDDAASGQGLARPYIPIPFVSHSVVVPTDTTTSATFTGLLSARYKKQHPKLYAQVLCRASDGTTSGEVRIIKVSGAVQIGGTGTIGLGAYGLVAIGPGDVPGGHLEEMELEVQARRTAGAGTIGVRMFGCWAQQS